MPLPAADHCMPASSAANLSFTGASSIALGQKQRGRPGGKREGEGRPGMK